MPRSKHTTPPKRRTPTPTQDRGHSTSGDLSYGASQNDLATGHVRLHNTGVASESAVEPVGASFSTQLVADRIDESAISARSPSEALASFETAADLRPFDSIHPELAVAAMQGIPDAALISGQISMLDDSLRWAPRDGRLLLAQAGLLFDLYEMTGDTDPLKQARDLLIALTARDATNGAGFLRLGAIQFHLGDLEAAERSWVEAQRLMPHRSEAAGNLMVLRGG